MLGIIAVLCLQSAPEKPSLEGLLRRLPAVAAVGDNGIGKEKQDLTQQIRAFEGAAIPKLLELLKSDDPRVRDLVGYVLRDIRGIQPEHLDSLIDACRDGNGWIAPAIAHVGTPRAIAFLVEDLEARPGTHTQVTWALRCAGESAAIALANRFTTDDPVTQGFANCVGYVLGEMEGRAAPAIGILLGVATNKQLDDANRSLAVEVLGDIGPSAHSTIPVLRNLEAEEPDLFSKAVERAILGMRGPEAVEILLRQLGDGDVLTLRDIADLRENGFEAGRAVTGLLRAEDRDVRVAAARTLGFIQFTPAVDALLLEASEPDDWKLAWAAVESLGRLHARRAAPELMWIAGHYWYPPVCAAAREALRAICRGDPYPLRFHPRNFPFEFFYALDGQRAETPRGARPALAHEPEALTDSELKGLAYDLEGGRRSGKSGDGRRVTPSLGIRVDAGVLVGSNRGEWGGELVLLRTDHTPQVVLNENLVGVHVTASGIVAVTGLAHLSFNDGALYRIDPRPDGNFVAAWWKRLPGEPEISGLLPDGALFVRCRGGDVVVTTAGDIRMADAR